MEKEAVPVQEYILGRRIGMQNSADSPINNSPKIREKYRVQRSALEQILHFILQMLKSFSLARWITQVMFLDQYQCFFLRIHALVN